MGKFAVIDTEPNWADQVMSIGTVIADADCCSTGRLRRGYGVEPMLRLLSGNRTYHESHNTFFDAMDELEIMRLLAHPLESYKS